MKLSTTHFIFCGFACILSTTAVQANTPSPTELKSRELEQNFNLTKLPQNLQSQERSHARSSNESSIPTLSSEQLVQQPDLLEHALYSSVAYQNVLAVKQLLPLYQTLPQAQQPKGQLLRQMATALLATEAGELKHAIQIYREIIATYPHMSDVRFFLAQRLFDDQQNEAAEDQFTRLRSEPHLPDIQQRQVEHYLTALKKRDAWRFSGGLGYYYDPNANNTPKNRTIHMNGGTWTFDQPEEIQGIGYQLYAERPWNIKGNYYAHFSGSVQGKSYWTNQTYNDLIGHTQLGILYKDTRREVQISPYYKKRWSGNEPYTHESGINVSGSYWLSNKHQLSAVGEWGKEQFDTRNRKASGAITSGSITWLYLPHARQYWTFGSDYTDKQAIDPSRAYQRYAIRASWTQEWKYGISSSLALDIARREYGAEDIFRIQRKETEYTARLALWHRDWHIWGITPRLVMSYQTTKGNHPVYEYDKQQSYLQFSKRF